MMTNRVGGMERSKRKEEVLEKWADEEKGGGWMQNVLKKGNWICIWKAVCCETTKDQR